MNEILIAVLCVSIPTLITSLANLSIAIMKQRSKRKHDKISVMDEALNKFSFTIEANRIQCNAGLGYNFRPAIIAVMPHFSTKIAAKLREVLAIDSNTDNLSLIVKKLHCIVEEMSLEIKAIR